MPYIKTHSNYVLSKRHQSVSDGMVWERDITTIGGVNQFSPGQLPIYRSSNFIITVRNDGKVSNQHNNGKWIENESGDVWTLQTLSGITSDFEEQNDTKIVLKKDYYDFRDFAYYGSLTELFRSSLNDIFMRFPGELYYSVDNPHVYYYEEEQPYEIGGIKDMEKMSTSILGTSLSHEVSNPFGIDIHSLKKPDDADALKYFANDGYKNYQVFRNDNTEGYDITDWSPPRILKEKYCPGERIGVITIEWDDGSLDIECFVGDENKIYYLSSDSRNIHIRPKEEFIAKFYNECNNFEKLILDRTSTPMYKSSFSVIKENEHGYYREMEEFLFPTSYGGYNIDASNDGFTDFSARLLEIGEFYDGLFTDNLYRSMTHEAIKNFDWTYTREFNEGDEEEYKFGGEKIQKALRIFAREFDEILSYINEIKNCNRITYDERSNLPNYFLTDAVENKGWDVKLVYPYSLEEYMVDGDGNKVINESGSTIYIKHSEYKENDETDSQLENKHGEYFIVRQFSQDSKKEINPYSINMIPEEYYPYGYFMTCCEGKQPCEYSGSPYHFLDASGSGVTIIHTCSGKTEIKDRIKTYTDEKPYTYFDVNNEFMKRLAINSPYIWRRKGTIEGIETILGMFGLKSQRWLDRLHKGCKESDLVADYEIIEYTSFTNRIEEEWDAVHQMYRIDWINSTKTILNDSRLRNKDIHKDNSTDWGYVSYQGLPVAELDDVVQIDSGETIINEPYIKISPLGAQSATSESTEAFTKIDKQNSPVTRRYLYPYFTKDELLDGNPYYQMKGGWLSNTVSNVGESTVYNFQYDTEDNISYTCEVAKGDETQDGIIDNHPLFKETVRNIKRVDTIQDLINTPLNNLKEKTVYYVSNVEKDIAIINNAVYKIQYEHEYSGDTQDENPKPLMYVTLRKENGNIKIGDGTYFDETITVYAKYPRVESNDNESDSTIYFGDYMLRECSYYLLDKDDGYEIKAYIGYDDEKTKFDFVCKDKLEGAYTINSFVVLDSIASENDTNYFIIYNPYYGNRIASPNDNNGWVRLKDKDPEYVRINTIVNYYKGNNPHNGNMDYDLGHSYFLYYKKLFKYAIENYFFDKRCYENFYTTLYGEIYDYGFKNLIEDNEEIKQYAPYMLTDDKIHYFGNYYKRDDDSGFTNCETIMYYGDNSETEWRLQKMYNYLNDNIKVGKYILKDKEMIGGTPYVFSEDNENIDIEKIDSITNQIVNNKRLSIRFYLHNEWHTNEGQTELKYLDSVVMNYLSQMIPSTAIVDVQYRYAVNNENDVDNNND